MMIRRTLPLILLVGCSFLSRTKNNFYSLDRLPPAAAVASVPGVAVGIDTLELPPGVDRREIVVRQAGHLVDVRSTEQWSAPFKALVLHTLASDLASRLPEGMVIMPGEAKPAGTRPIDVFFEELAVGPDASVTVDARWTMAAVEHHERIRVDIPSLDSANIATGMSQALAALADRMAAGIK